jgi:hypothetical protein
VKFKKVEAGLYVSEDGLWEVQRDPTGYVTIDQRDGDGLLAGCDDDGWSLASGDEVIDWFDTKREAIAAAERLAQSEVGQ